METGSENGRSAAITQAVTEGGPSVPGSTPATQSPQCETPSAGSDALQVLSNLAEALQKGGGWNTNLLHQAADRYLNGQ